MRLDLASLLGLVYILSEFGLAMKKRASVKESAGADRGSLALLWMTISVSTGLAYGFREQFPHAAFAAAAAPAARIVGAVLFAVGLTIRWLAIIYLGRFFTVNVAIAADHQLIDGGPYRWVRHPSYSGALLAFVGLGLCMGNWVSLAAVTAPVFLVFLNRMRVEESALSLGLGPKYRDYMARTKRLIPAVY